MAFFTSCVWRIRPFLDVARHQHHVFIGPACTLLRLLQGDALPHGLNQPPALLKADPVPIEDQLNLAVIVGGALSQFLKRRHPDQRDLLKLIYLPVDLRKFGFVSLTRYTYLRRPQTLADGLLHPSGPVLNQRGPSLPEGLQRVLVSLHFLHRNGEQRFKGLQDHEVIRLLHGLRHVGLGAPVDVRLLAVALCAACTRPVAASSAFLTGQQTGQQILLLCQLRLSPSGSVKDSNHGLPRGPVKHGIPLALQKLTFMFQQTGNAGVEQGLPEGLTLPLLAEGGQDATRVQ